MLTGVGTGSWVHTTGALAGTAGEGGGAGCGRVSLLPSASRALVALAACTAWYSIMICVSSSL